MLFYFSSAQKAQNIADKICVFLDTPLHFSDILINIKNTGDIMAVKIRLPT